MRTVLAALFALAASLQVVCIDLKAIKEHILAVPSQCTSLCTGPQQTLDNCTPTANFTSCLCSDTILVSIFNCFTCIGTAINTMNYTVAQSDLDQITSACDAFGTHLDPLTLPGQDSNRFFPTTVIGMPPSSSSAAESQNGGAGTTNVSPSVTGIPSPSSGSTTTSASQTSSLPTQTVPSSLSPTASGTQAAGGKGNSASQQKASRGVLIIAAFFGLIASG